MTANVIIVIIVVVRAPKVWCETH